MCTAALFIIAEVKGGNPKVYQLIMDFLDVVYPYHGLLFGKGKERNEVLGCAMTYMNEFLKQYTK